MNIPNQSPLRPAILAILVTAFASFAAGPMARGATFTWDSGGLSFGNPADGSGAWNTSTADWSTGSGDVDWSSGNNAVIGDANGAAGTITVGTVSVGNITFNPPGSGSYTLSGGSITLTSGTIATNAASATISSELLGSAGLTTGGTGTLILTTACSYTGTTTVTGGTLELQSAATSVVPDASAIVITGGTMELNGSTNNIIHLNPSETIGAGGTMLNVNQTVSLGPVNLTGGVLSGSNNEATYGSYYFTGAVNVSGGTQSTISAATFDPDGETFTVANGSSLLLTGSAISQVGGMTINAGGAAQIGNGTTDGFWAGNIADSGTLAYNLVGTQTDLYSITGTGVVTKAGAGTLVFQNSAQDIATAVSIVITGGTIEFNGSGATPNLINGNAVTIGAGGTMLNVNGVASPGTVSLTGGVISGSNSGTTYGSYFFTGPVNVSGGAQSTISAYSMDPNGQTFTVANGSTLLISSKILTGGLATAGAGTVVLTGSTTSGEPLVIGGGNVQIGNGTTDGYWSGAITDNGALTYNILGTQNSGTITSGTGTLTKNGIGTVIMAGASYSGTTTVNAGTLEFTAPISNSTAIVIIGGTMELNYGTNNIFSGNAVTIGAGGTMFNAGNATTMGTVTLTGGVLSGSNSEATYGSYLFNGPVNVSGGTQSTISAATMNPNGETFTVANGSSLLVSSQMLTSGFTMAGGGTMVLTGSTTSGAAMTISSGTGTVQIGNGTTGGFWSGPIADSGTLVFDSPSAQTYAGAISGTGAVTISGSGAQTFSADPLTTISTLTIGSGATLNLSNAANNQLPNSTTSALSISGTLDITTASANTIYGPTVTLNNGTMTSTGGAPSDGFGAYFVNSAVTITASGTANTISGNGGFGINSHILTLNTPLSTDALTVSTILGTSGASGGGLTKSGLGTVTLTAANAYTGATTVSAGKMIVSGSLTGTVSTSVAAGATLEADGLVNLGAANTVNGTLTGNGSVGAVNVSGSGSVLAPGYNSSLNTAGTLTAHGNVTLSSTSTFALRLGVASGSDNDQLAMSGGSVSLNGAALQLTLGPALNNPANVGLAYIIINGGAGTGAGEFSFGGNAIANDGTFTTNGFTFEVIYGGTNVGRNTIGNSSDDELVLTAVPEPGTWATILGGLAMLSIYQRRRGRSRL